MAGLHIVFLSLFIASIHAGSSAGHYALSDEYSAFNSTFFSAFNFSVEPDPSHGFVQYVDLSTALNESLAGIQMDGAGIGSVYLGVEYQNMAPQGRKSIRAESLKSFNHGLFIADIYHMPGPVCGTWPAFWLVGPNWPVGGEIDVVEGVNDSPFNSMTLHTSPGCTLSEPVSVTSNQTRSTQNGTASLATSSFSGTVSTSDCSTSAANQTPNAGCTIRDPSPLSYGSAFNTNSGGVFALEWTSGQISVWFFPRSGIPADIANQAPQPSTWGVPRARWGSGTGASGEGGCDIDDHFRDLRLVFDTSLCGDWAGRAWAQSAGCLARATTCDEFVAGNPNDFVEAYWSIASVRVYEWNEEEGL